MASWLGLPIAASADAARIDNVITLVHVRHPPTEVERSIRTIFTSAAFAIAHNRYSITNIVIQTRSMKFQ